MGTKKSSLAKGGTIVKPMSTEQIISEMELLLVHLSDIHFHKRSGGPFDLDEDLRLALETDACEFIKKRGKSVDGILITGDIAYSGKKIEYECANKWLFSLCKKINCPEENVWTVPGNHDVDRDIISDNDAIKILHQDLRLKELVNINDGIEKLFSKDLNKTLLYSPLSHYMGFNKLYEGSIKKDGSLYWEYSLPLNDGSQLKIRGLNSTLVSNSLDDDKTNKLVLGEKQVQLPMNNPSVAYLTLCHHPPDWLLDKDNIESYLNSRALVQLFGHKHSQEIQRVNNSLRIVAGATHPERDDSKWLPRYNFLALHVAKDNDERRLIVNIYPRQWCKSETKFMADLDDNDSQVRKYALNLPRLESVSENSKLITSITKETNELKDDAMASESTDQIVMVENPYRKLVYRFYSLSFDMRYRIARDLKLVSSEDESIEEADLFRNIFLRAKDEKLLCSLWEKVEKAHGGDEKSSENPFKGS